MQKGEAPGQHRCTAVVRKEADRGTGQIGTVIDDAEATTAKPHSRGVGGRHGEAHGDSRIGRRTIAAEHIATDDRSTRLIRCNKPCITLDDLDTAWRWLATAGGEEPGKGQGYKARPSLAIWPLLILPYADLNLFLREGSAVAPAKLHSRPRLLVDCLRCGFLTACRGPGRNAHPGCGD